jgi:hypothetical protein
MQRVVRSTFVGLLAIASLTACGDKVTVPQTTTTVVTPPSNIISVTVTPASANMAIGDKIGFAASVNAAAGATDRTVTWSSSDATIVSVDANGLATALKGGTATIIAKSKADPTVQGAAVVTVAGVTNSAPATVSISTVNQTICSAVTGTCSSVPANLGNVAGQIDVTLNVDPGNQRLLGVDLIMNCAAPNGSGVDTVIASQTLAATSVAEAAAASAPVTLSFNTATFNSTTGAVAFRNGQCTLKARARTNATAGGAVTTVTSTASTITLNNIDAVIGSIASTKTAIRPADGLIWNGGDVTVTATPVMFSGRVPATMNINFECRTVQVTGAGTKTATFVDANDGIANQVAPGCVAGATPTAGNAAPAANDIDNITDAAAAASFALVDAAGQPFANPATCGAAAICSATSYLANPNAPAAIATIRLDTQAPLPGSIALANNVDQGTSANGYLGANFRFVADSAAGYRGPNAVAGNQTLNSDQGGVDVVTVSFASASSVTGTFTALTNTSNLSETTSTTSRTLIQITTDALGNADTSMVFPSAAYLAANGNPVISFRNALANGTPGALSAAGISRFGVDKTAPILTVTGSTNLSSAQTIGGTGSLFLTIQDALSGPANQQLVAQVRQTANLNGNSTLPANGTISTNGTENVASNAGCVIGQYFTTAAAAGPNALPVLLADGTNAGFCKPTPYTLAPLAGGNVLVANFGSASAYVTSRVIAVDQAGNQTAATTVQVVEDTGNPSILNVDMPQTISGNSTATFPAAATDNLDVTGSYAQVTYAGSGFTLQYPIVPGPGAAFDNVLTRATAGVAVNPTAPNFIKNIQVNNGAAAVSTTTVAGNQAASANVCATDEVLRAGCSGTITFAPATGISVTGSSAFSGNFNAGFNITASAATISNCAATGCAGGVAAANPTSTTLTATAAGQTGVFSNPFNNVQFWYQVPGSTQWFFAGTVTAALSRDTGPGGNRFWDYVLAWDPATNAGLDAATNPATNVSLVPPAAGTIVVNVRAIGVTSSGDAVASPAIAVTLTNP